MLPTHQQIDENIGTQLDDSIQSRTKPVNYGLSDITVPFDNVYNSGLIFNVSTISDNIPAWSIYPARRDRALRAFYKTEPIAAGAVYSISAKMKSLSWKLNGDETMQGDVWAMLNGADLGDGLSGLLGKLIIDYATQDNGFFIEKIGAGAVDSQLLGPVTGILQLDSGQCWRTFDPEFPVMYVDPINGTRHKMHRSRIVSRSSMQMPNELARGIGYCPISRALLSVKMMKSIMEYRYEKASGAFERGIIFGSGITSTTLDSLLQGNQLNMETEGLTRLSNMPAYVTIQGVKLEVLDLASIPDNWDTMTETELYVYTMALAFGVDAREFWPATQTGATKGDASVQHMKAKGKGFADMLTTIEEVFNTEILPDGMTLEADFIDDEQDKQKAEKDSIVATTFSKIKADGAIDTIEERALLIDSGVLNPDTLEGARDLPGMSQFVIDFEQRQADMVAQLEPNADSDETDNENGAGDTGEDNDNPFDADKMTGGVWRFVDNIKIYTPIQRLDFKPIDKQGRYYGVKDKAGYGASLRAIGRGIFLGEVTPFNTIAAMDGSIARHYTQAWREGFASEGIRPDEISIEERSTLNSLIQAEKQFVIKFVEWVVQENSAENGGKFSLLFNRLLLWENRYDMIKAKAKLLAAGNKKLEWRFDPTKEHCFPAGTMVTMANGDDKPIETVVIGDYVMTNEGSKQVTSVMINDHEGVLYEITQGGKTVQCTPNHPFLTQRGWIRADGLQSSDYIVTLEDSNNNRLGHIALPNPDNRIPAFVKVFILAYIALLLCYLPISQWVKPWVPVPIVPVRLDNQITNTTIDNELRFDHEKRFMFNSQIAQDSKQFQFQFSRVAFLQSSMTFKHCLHYSIPSPAFGLGFHDFGNSFRIEHGVMSSHVFTSGIMDLCSEYIGLQSYTQYSGSILNLGNSHLQSTSRNMGGLIGVSYTQNVIKFWTPQRFLIHVMMTIVAFTVAYIAAFRTITPFRTPFGFIFNGVTGSPRFLMPSVKGVSTNDTTEPLTVTDNILITKFAQLRQDNDLSMRQISTGIITVYNLEVKDNHQYFVSGLLAHNCIDCVRLNGRVYRANIWDKWNIAPQSPRLACFGGYCGCGFFETTKAITKGRPPALTGVKELSGAAKVAYDTLILAIKDGRYTKRLSRAAQKAIEAFYRDD